jgi:hypothetical protein
MRCAWRADRALLAAALALAGSAAAAQGRAWIATQADNDTAAKVMSHLEHKDCAGAARTLDGGVKQGHPTVLLMAGVMFEEGLCVKTSWERALGYYEQSHAAGQPRAAARMASGFASAAAGPDRAAALWWAHQADLPLPEPCWIADDKLVADPDAFVKVLQGWPAGRLDACVYTGAVVATIAGDLRFSARAQVSGLRGELVTRFVPATGSVEIRTDDLDFIPLLGNVSGDELRDRDSRRVRREFEREIRLVADRGLQRFAKPAVIDSAWTVTIKHSFGYVLR